MLSDSKKEFGYSRVKRAPYFEMKEEHYHPNHEIYYLKAGIRKFFIGDTVYTVQSGDLILIPEGEIHKVTFFAKDEEHERIAINFSDAFLARLYEDVPKESVMKCLKRHEFRIPVAKREYVDGLFQKMEEESVFMAEKPDAKVLVKAALYELLIFLIRQQNEKDTPKEVVSTDITMEEAAQYIYSHYHQELSLEEISKRYHMSTSYFSRKFKKVTGFGFKEYVNVLRLKEACALLKESNLTVTEIAMQCGFESSNYFGDLFHKTQGMSPRDYRKKYQDGKG